jgi:hypothetical protein
MSLGSFQSHDTIDTPQIRYNFTRLDQMENLQKDSTCGKIKQLIHPSY